jgi:hypothetical protein
MTKIISWRRLRLVKLHSLRVELLPLLKIEEDEEEDAKLCNANNSDKLLIYNVAKHDRIG